MITENTTKERAGPDQSATEGSLSEESINSSDRSSSFIIIEPQKFLYYWDLKGIWNYRELFYFLMLRDLKIRYKQTLLGILWVLLQPAISTVIFTIVFYRINAGADFGVPYPLFAFSGFTLWTFINSAIINSSNSLLNHSGLITKIYFPRLIIPLSAASATLVDLIFGLISLLIAMAAFGVAPTWRMLLVLLLAVPALFLAAGVGIFAAALNVKYRDVKYILPFLIQIFFFISPIFYSLSILPNEVIWLWKLNPLTGLLENFRAMLFGLDFDWSSFGISTVISLTIFILSTYIFHRMEDDFADVI